jgi:hypothetical protein
VLVQEAEVPGAAKKPAILAPYAQKLRRFKNVYNS